jgi:uncharacterized membrane protein YidH (DUF202 family)
MSMGKKKKGKKERFKEERGKKRAKGAERKVGGFVSSSQRFQKLEPYLPAILFFILTILLFGVLRDFIFSGQMLYGTDAMSHRVFWNYFYSDFWRTYHTMPLWDPYIHGGMPFVDGMHGAIFYPLKVLLIFLLPVAYAMGLKLVLHVFLAGLLMFYFLRDLNLRRWVSFLGGLLYMFSPCLISLIYPGHDGKMYVMALTPLAFLVLNRGLRSGKLFHFLIFSLVFALLIFSAHMQMAYFACWGLGLFFLFQLWKIYREGNRKILKYVAYFVISIILGLSISMIQLLSPYIYLKTHSMRTMHTEDRGGYEYAASWSMHWEELASEVVPEFCGDNIHTQGNFYWGRNPFKLNSEYIGLLALFLAVLTLIYRRNRFIWFFTGLGILAFIYALGATTPFFRIFYHLVPGVKNFRGPSMINFLFCFATVTIAMLGLENYFNLKDKKVEIDKFLKIALICVIVYSGLAILITVLGKSFFDLWISILYSGIEPAKRTALINNIPRIIGGVWISTLLLWLIYALLHFHLKGVLKEGIVVGALALIALIDLFRVNTRFLVIVDSDQYYRKSAVVDFFQEKRKEEPSRVFMLPNTFQDNYLARYGIEEVSLTAMHGNHLRTYDEFVGRHEQNPNLPRPNFMNLLNVKYILSPSQLNTPQLQEVGKEDRIYVYQNLNYLPRAFPVYSWEVVRDEGEILSRLKNPEFDVRQKLFLAAVPPNIPSAETRLSFAGITPAKVHDYRINSFKVDVEMEEDGFLFLSENYYPAWKAYVDGEKTEIYRADYTFRAVYLDKGNHQVEFVFDSPSYNISKKISGISLLFVFFVLVFSFFKEPFYRKAQRKS